MKDATSHLRPLAGAAPASVLRALLACAAIACCAAFQAPARADFQKPVRIGEGDEKVDSYCLGLDFFENLLAAYEQGGELWVETRTTDATDRISLGTGAEPSLAFSPLGVFVAYCGPDAAPGGPRRILLDLRLGSQWRETRTLSSSPGEDHFPSLQVDAGGQPVVAWEKQIPGQASRIMFRREGQESVIVAAGERPALAIDTQGRAHIAYIEGGDVHYSLEATGNPPGVFSEPRNITQTPGEQESAPRMALGAAGTLYVAYSRAGAVWLASNESGDFAATRVEDESAASNPSLALSPSGALAVAYEAAGGIHATLGTSFFLPAGTAVTESPEAGRDPVVLVDSFASVFVAFLRDGALYYTTTAGVPQARFSAEPPEGEAPLEVHFRDESLGAVTAWQWSFGDGATSVTQHPSHVFQESGDYTVSLRVSGPGGQSPVLSRQVLRVLSPSNEMHVADVRAFPGQAGVHVPVIAAHADPAQGFTIAARYDPSLLDVRSVEFEYSNIQSLQPELFAVEISDDPEDPYVTAGILFDVAVPFDGRVLSPGKDYRIANIIVDVHPGAPAGTTTQIRLENHVGHPPLNNIITVKGFTVLPVLKKPGVVWISHLVFPPPRFFIRGDANGDGKVNIADPVSILNHLFMGGEEPACHDAADASDNGEVDISDAVQTLAFLFRSGAYPPPPFPEPGLDPTEDDLPPCLLR